MSHVDEGRLHAFLDGALGAADPADAERVELHLASCADCRAKLEDATRLRDEAAALLGSARPRAFDMPSFESIRARSVEISARATPAAAISADMERPAPRRGWRSTALASPFNGLAWAATIVLAIGLGWMLREGVDDSTRVPIRSMSGETIEERGSAPMESQPLEVAEAAAPPAGPSADALRDGAPARAQNAATQTGESTGTPERQVTPDDLEARAPGSSERMRSGTAALAESDASRPPVRSPSPPPQSDAALDRRADYDVAPEQAAGLAGAGEAYAVVPSRWQPVPLAEARRILGGRLAVPAGASVVSAARGTGASLEVRTVQRTSRGETIEVVQRTAAVLGDARSESSRSAEAAETPQSSAPADAKPSSTVRWGDWTVTISGAVSEDRLEELTGQLP